MGAIVFCSLIVIGYWLWKRWSKGGRSGGLDMRWTRPQLARDEPKRKHQRSPLAADYWVPPARPSSVAGLSLPDGMLYVGQGLPDASDRGLEPSLIDPALPVDVKQPSSDLELVGSFPEYARLTARQRGGYVRWLSTGRADPKAPISFVFLFFTGLERRAFVDAKADAAAAAELPAIRAEVERLLGVYGNDALFRRYASEFVGYLRATQPGQKLYATPPRSYSRGMDFPLELSVALGQLVAEGLPIPAAWAFAWFSYHPSTRTRTPAERCATQFRELFALRYARRYGPGLRLAPNKTPLRIRYRAMNGGVRDVATAMDPLPDVSALKRPVNRLRALAESCMNDLDGLSRFLGRYPDQAGSLEAFALLPPELRKGTSNAVVDGLRLWLDGVLPPAARRASVDTTELIGRWSHAKAGKLSKREASGLAQVLESLGVGLEPDVRFVGAPLRGERRAILFRIDGQGAAAASTAYRSSALLLHLASAVAAADGSISEQEEQHLMKHIQGSMQLEPAEQQRLEAHLAWLLSEQPNLTGLKAKLEGVPDATRRRIALFAVSVAGADGRIDPKEVKVLRQLYAGLGLDPDSLYADIHSLAGKPAAGPVTVQVADPVARGRRIPPPPDRQPEAAQREPEPADGETGFVLDMSKVRAKLQETSEVSALLADIFADAADGSPASEPPPPDVTASDSASALDPAHASILKELDASDSFSRQEFEKLVARFDLMPDGTFDSLNEVALDTCNALLLDGDDPIAVNRQVLREMTHAQR